MIYIFGDSFSENLWPSMLTNDINTPHTNYAKSGCTNNDILHSIVSKLDYFKKNDIVIIQLSGQGRLNVGGKVIYGNKKRVSGFTKDEHKTVIDWYNTFYIPSIIKEDKTINSIINIANFLSDKHKVILWNLSKLDSISLINKKLNDNISSSPKIPHSHLWLPLSDKGKKGWVEIIYERGLNTSNTDYHPNKAGNKFIAEEIKKQINKLFI